MKKTEIISLSYNAMFKAVFYDNKKVLINIIQAIFDYCNFKIDIEEDNLIIRNNELPIGNAHDKQLVCDYIIKIDDNTDLNIEINRTSYPGLVERNMTYSFKIYCDHFKSGDKYPELNKYNLIQVNFNNFSNPDGRCINKFFLIDTDNIVNYLSKNLCIINIDIASCFKLVYNNDKLDEISMLERLSAMLFPDTLEDISAIIRSDIMDKETKEKFLDDVVEKSKDKDIGEAIKLEDNINYRFKLMEEDALNRGLEQGIEQTIIDTINRMMQDNVSLETISKYTGKTIEEIKIIQKSLDN